jgi:lipopolysaccharide biosynthesis glycosyltransferase
LPNQPDINLDIVILCNKLDFFLTKICVASIRYYYPLIPVYIVKDELNGKFSTTEMESRFDVKILDLGLKKYGWCTGKISALLSSQHANKKMLLLDSDIIFIGKVLDKLIPELYKNDFIVSPEHHIETNTSWFKGTYYNMEWALRTYPDFIFPGFTFNCGQMVITPGKFKKEELINYIDLSKFPYWTKLTSELLPNRDQSLLNVLLPLKQSRKEISLSPIAFQLWSGTKEIIDKLNLKQITSNEGYPFLIHWAGVLRIPYLKKMTRSDILLFFQKEYYKKLIAGELRRIINNSYHFFRFTTRKFIKSIIRR